MARKFVVNLGPVIQDPGPLKMGRLPLKRGDLESAWRIVGPTVWHNIDKFPLWKTIAIAYVEGLNHGSGVEREFNAPYGLDQTH